MTMRRHLWVMGLAVVLGAAGCNDEGVATPGVSAPDAGPSPGPPDAGAAPDPAAVPITAWIHDLVKAYGPMSAPDTVDDKRLIDTEDPGAFDSLLE